MFRIQTSNGAVAGHQARKEVAGLDARQSLQAKMKQFHAQATDPWFRGRVDVQDANKNYQQYKKSYEKCCPETLTPAVQNDMWKRAKQLKDEFTVGMLSTDELHPIKSIQVDGAIQNIVDSEKISTNRTVERNTLWYRANEKKIVEFKNIMRHLNPDDPMASDIERFRPRRKTI